MSKSPSRFDMNARRVTSGGKTGFRSLAVLLVRWVTCEPSGRMVNSSKSPSRSELKARSPFPPGNAALVEDAKAIATTAAHPPASHLIPGQVKAWESSAGSAGRGWVTARQAESGLRHG